MLLHYLTRSSCYFSLTDASLALDLVAKHAVDVAIVIIQGWEVPKEKLDIRYTLFETNVIQNTMVGNSTVSYSWLSHFPRRPQTYGHCLRARSTKSLLTVGNFSEKLFANHGGRHICDGMRRCPLEVLCKYMLPTSSFLDLYLRIATLERKGRKELMSVLPFLKPEKLKHISRNGRGDVVEIYPNWWTLKQLCTTSSTPYCLH